jgi:2-polyprenyl-6-methoxyphenol hydroxylase-like FAD-dependent oxidoreductase
MPDTQVLIAGGGIAGLTLALTLHQIGVPCRVYESAPEMKPLGVGINLQPNAVRELFDLGIGAGDLDRVGLPAREWALVGLNGNDIHAEPRGLDAGYHWPQYAVHRGAFHMLLFEKVKERLGPGAVVSGARATSYAQDGEGVTIDLTLADSSHAKARGTLLVGADGIRSLIRTQMYPDRGHIHWGGALMWRGTVRAAPIRTGSSFVGLGTDRQRMVIYPISRPDADGKALINWIAEVTVDSEGGWPGDRWFVPARIEDFVHHFDAYRYPWLDVPAMLRAAEVAYVNPMIDRDPIPGWIDGRVALMGDAAHAMYPTGSNGASQAIVDARTIGAKMLAHGVTEAALAAYDAELCGPVSELVLRNRKAGPFGLLTLVDERCGGVFDDIDEVIPPDERAAFIAEYKAAAGFDIARLNARPPIIPPGARVGAA